jgi:hypothetical protein
MSNGPIRPWSAGAATSTGSLPGTDSAEAVRLVFGELPELPFLPELPARGPGAEMIGRTAALLVSLPVEIAPTGWRLAAHPGGDQRRAEDFLARDLDALEAQAEGYGGSLKLQITGPWTLAAALELPNGHRVVSDQGATRDLAASLAEGLRTHLAEVTRRVPAARLSVQVDEPGLPTVLAGAVPTLSGYGTVRAIDLPLAQAALRDVLAVAPEGGRIVHCCAADAPLRQLVEAGADALALDLARLGAHNYDTLGAIVDDGVSLWLGVLPSTDAPISLDTAREPLRRIWSELGFPLARLAESVVPTTACGLAGASPGYVRRAFTVLRDTGHSLLEDA